MAVGHASIKMKNRSVLAKTTLFVDIPCFLWFPKAIIFIIKQKEGIATEKAAF